MVTCHTEKDAHEAYRRLKEWFAPRGLAFNEEKTSVRHLTDGFDFLGCTIRTYDNGYTLVTPSKDAVRKAKGRIRDVVRSNRGKPADRLVPELNSFLRGWTAYYRPWSSKRAFKEVERIVFGQLWQWASRQHRRKGRQWIAARYWDKRIPGSDNRWIFGEGSAYVKPAAMTRIVRHVPVLGTHSKDDPALTDYWTERAARRTKLGLENRFIQTLAVRQRGRCARCGLDLVEGAEFEPDNIHDWVSWFDSVRRTLNVHHVVHRQHGGGNELKNLILLHSQCHEQHHATEALDAKRSQ